MTKQTVRFLFAIGLVIVSSGCADTAIPSPTLQNPTSAAEAHQNEVARASTVPPTQIPADTPLPSPSRTPTARPEGWIEIKTNPGSSPLPRSGHAMIVLPDGRILLFGGQDENGNPLNDTWILSFNEQARIVPHKVPGRMRLYPRSLFDWNPLNSPHSPQSRYGHSVVSSNGNIYLFGGTDGQQQFNDIYLYTDDWQQVQTPNQSISPRYYQQQFGGEFIYVFGGVGTTAEGRITLLQDLWRYDANTNAWEQMANPPGSISPSAFPAVHGNKVHFLDPHIQAARGGATYVYDMASGKWEQNQLQGIWPPGERSNMMWTQVGATVYMLGGSFWDAASQSLEKTAEVWGFSLSTGNWVRLLDMPYALSGGVAVFHPARNEIIVWGGNVKTPHHSYLSYRLVP